jgi:dihydrofolate reductase
VLVLRDVASVLSAAKDLNRDLFVIGGGQVYAAFLPYIEKWIVTEVPIVVDGADAFVPENYLDGFTKAASWEIEPGLKANVYLRNEGLQWKRP